MNELKDVSVGDFVLVRVSARIGAFDSKEFHVKAAVEKETKTQLTVNGQRYIRENGREYGARQGYSGFSRSTSYIYPLDNRQGYTDQTAEYEVFKVTVDKAKQVNGVCKEILDKVGYQTPNLDEIHKSLMQVKAHLTQLKS